MRTKNYYLLSAGVICLFTAFLHTIGGQIDLIDPLIGSELNVQTKTELLGVWHMVTILIFISALVLLRSGFRAGVRQKEAISLIAYLFLGFGLVFILVSILNNALAPQWILCLPIGILSLLGARRLQSTTT